MVEMGKPMKNQPKFIYLQTGLEEYGETFEDFEELDSNLISWRADKIYSDDLEYISVFSVLARIKELEEKLIPKISTQTRVTIMYTINELKQLIK